jgi:hypothetical protein
MLKSTKKKKPHKVGTSVKLKQIFRMRGFGLESCLHHVLDE